MTNHFNHPQALVESAQIGSGTRIWAFAHVMPNVSIGNDCNLCGHTFVESGARIGNNVTIKNHVCIWDGVTIEDDVFVGPHATFTNDRYPRSARMPHAQQRYENRDDWLIQTLVKKGCSIGANATIIGGITLGKYSLIAAGATVTRNVKPFALMVGNPARQRAWVCRCGMRLEGSNSTMTCTSCGEEIHVGG